MTIRNLTTALAPRSIALIGASERHASVGRVVLENVCASFSGAIYSVNPKYRSLLGRPCYRQVADLPEAPDLAVVMTPAPTVPDLIHQLGSSGCRTAVVVSAGLSGETGLRQPMLDAAQRYGLRIIGPNTIGLLAPRVGLNASFAHLTPAHGRIALISQSGAIVSSMIDWAVAERIGFSQVFSLGDMADVDIGDCLDLLAQDEQTDAILLYLEAITHPRKFMSAARAASRIKPVIAVKPGRHAEAAKAATTHTGALAGVDRIIDAVLRRAGIIRVPDLEDLFDAAEVTGRYRPLRRARTAIVTNGGGAGVLAVDDLLDEGAALATLGPKTIAALDAALPATWSRANPVDIIGDAPPQRYRLGLEAVAADDNVDAILAMNCPTGLADPLESARATADIAVAGLIGGKPVLACWLGKQAAGPARALLQASGIGSFDTPTHAAQAIALLTRWSELRTQLEQVPPDVADIPLDHYAIDGILAGAAAEGRTQLTEPEAKAVLGHCGIAVPPTISCVDEDQVAAAAAQVLSASPAVVVKLQSRRISHKSDIGGVALNLLTVDDARGAAALIRARFERAWPGETLDGFTVQPMIRPRRLPELLAGLATDPVFGPVVIFGAGGTSVEVVDDTATGLVPLDAVLAGSMISRTRISRLLAGYRDVPPADTAAIAQTLVRLSELAIACPAIVSLDINPLVHSDAGVIALDARIEIDPARLGLPRPNPFLSIRPYPAGEESQVVLDGELYTLRPIRPSDAGLYPHFMEGMDPDDIRNRFLTSMSTISPALLVRLTQLDYDREIAFIAVNKSGELSGIVRYSADPDHRRAEFGALVRSDLKGRGLGLALMRRLLDYAQRDGIAEVFGLVMPDNQRMLGLCRDLGFAVDRRPSGQDLVRVSLRLSGPIGTVAGPA